MVHISVNPIITFANCFREWPFNNRGGGLRNIWLVTRKKPPLCTHEKVQPALEHIKNKPISSSYFIYTQIQLFFMKTTIL